MKKHIVFALFTLSSSLLCAPPHRTKDAIRLLQETTVLVRTALREMNTILKKSTSPLLTRSFEQLATLYSTLCTQNLARFTPKEAVSPQKKRLQLNIS